MLAFVLEFMSCRRDHMVSYPFIFYLLSMLYNHRDEVTLFSREQVSTYTIS